MIDDIKAPELEMYSQASEPQLLHMFEPAPGVFIAETPMIIERALDVGYEPLSMLVERGAETDASRLLTEHCRKCDVPVRIYSGEASVLTGITGYKLTRGMLCAMRRRSNPSLEEVCAGASRIVVLEDVMNPTNVGAIFRSATALGMDAVVLTSGSSDPLYRRAARVAMGTCFVLPWCYIEEQPGRSYLDTLRNMGWKTVAMALRRDSVAIGDPILKSAEKLAVIMGTEGEGLRDSTIDGADHTVKIPMFRGVDSLNVAAASAIACWELGKKS